MAGPNILNAGEDNTASDTDTTYYVSTSIALGANNISNVSAPASAKTAIVLVGCDKGYSESFDVSAITWGSLPIIKTLDINPDASTSVHSSGRVVRATIFDLSSSGAVDETLTYTTTASSSNQAITSVICTDGFVQSVHADGLRSQADYYSMTYSENGSNCGVLVVVYANGNITASTSGSGNGTKLFNRNTGGLSAYAFYQGASTDNVSEIQFESDANSVHTTFQALLSTQVDAFDGITGKMTKPIVK